MTNEPTTYQHYIYALIEREYLKSGEDIIKMGRTSRGLFKRMSNYPKGSLLLVAYPIKPSDIVVAESRLLSMARSMFTQVKSIGHEYFQADRIKVLKLMMKIGIHYTPSSADLRVYAKTLIIQPLSEEQQVESDGGAPATDDELPVSESDGETQETNNALPTGLSETNDGIPETDDETQENDDGSVSNAPQTTVTVVDENESRKIKLLSMDTHQRFFEFVKCHRDEIIGKTQNMMVLLDKYKAWLDLPNDKTSYFTFEQLMKSIGGVIKKDVDEWNVVFKALPSPTVVNPINHELNEYLSMQDMERGYKISKVPGRVTWLSEFKRIFTEFYIDVKISPCDYAKALRKYDFKVSTDYQYICRTCGQLASGKPKCCPGYNGITRLKKFVIYDMDMSKCTSIG